MNNIQSYVVLNDFKQELLANNFIGLPDEPAAEDLLPFQKIYEDYYTRLQSALADDLSSIGITNFQMAEHLFVPEDEYAQEATLCYQYILVIQNEQELSIAFKYFVFQNGIHCYLTGDISPDVIGHLTKSNQNFLKTLATNYHKGGVSHFYEFF